MYEEVTRFNPNEKTGLSEEQVNTRKNEKLTNKTKIVAVKSYWDIIRTNVLSFFNILLFVIAGLLIFVNVSDGKPETPWYKGLAFMFVLLGNIVLGLYQDITARKTISKLHLITSPKARVIRDSITKIISTDDLVLDDVVVLNASDQICADSILLSGKISVNESLLTGEPRSIIKMPGDLLYGGSYVVSGSGKARVDKVGKESYANKLQNEAKKFKRSPSKILSTLNSLFKILGSILLLFIAAYLLTYSLTNRLSSVQAFAVSFRPMAGSLVGMVPAGLYLLTSVALAAGVISLSRKKAQVQDFYAIEMLSHSDVLCVDKTGTITDGTMEVEKVIDYHSQEDLNNIIFNILHATNDNNVTAQALNKYFVDGKSLKVKRALPFNSDNKYSGVTLSNGDTYLIGAYEYLNITNKILFNKSIEDYSKKGLRVLAIVRGSNEIDNDENYSYKTTCIGLILLKDHIRDDAKETFAWFKNNGVEIKVISGDNPITVSEVANEVGIENAYSYISLEGMSIEQVKDIADKYTVFGRVTPEQKEAIVSSLKEKKKTVAMTGDGINDILALRRADCSIAMASGSDAAKNVSHIVLLEPNFSLLPAIVAEGRRVVNNLQRTSTLFLTKCGFSIFLSLFFLIGSMMGKDIYYPFTTSNLMLWEIFLIGLPAFFIALQPSKEIPKTSFIKGILLRTLPSVIMVILGVIAVYVLYLFNETNVMFTGVTSLKTASSMAVIIFTLLGITILLSNCRTFNLYRGLVFGINTLIVIGFLVGFGVYDIINGIPTNLFDINFTLLEPIHYLEIGIIVIVLSALYLCGISIYNIVKEVNSNDKNK